MQALQHRARGPSLSPFEGLCDSGHENLTRTSMCNGQVQGRSGTSIKPGGNPPTRLPQQHACVCFRKRSHGEGKRPAWVQLSATGTQVVNPVFPPTHRWLPLWTGIPLQLSAELKRLNFPNCKHTSVWSFLRQSQAPARTGARHLPAQQSRKRGTHGPPAWAKSPVTTVNFTAHGAQRRISGKPRPGEGFNPSRSPVLGESIKHTLKSHHFCYALFPL